MTQFYAPPVPPALMQAAIAGGQLVALGLLDADRVRRIVLESAEVHRAALMRDAAEAGHAMNYDMLGLHLALCWAMCDARGAMEISLAFQAEDARKAIGPALVGGADRGAALKLARQRAPDVPDADLGAVVDEECAWWIRWRHDRGFRAGQGIAA